MSYIFYIASNSAALRFAGRFLIQFGCRIAPLPGSEVTHLLLPVPSFDDSGELKGGGDIQTILTQLPKDIVIIGGNLPQKLTAQYQTLDLLKDAQYLADNAYITACCALRLAMMELPITLRKCKVLITGWGRIAQCLAQLLACLDADITIAARKEEARAMIHALGFMPLTIAQTTDSIEKYRLIFNTVPAEVISQNTAALCSEDCLKIDLASCPGIAGKHVISARGLPGKDAPESSGQLIAQTAIRLLRKKEV